MYWTDATANKIQRANLDGSNVETLVTRATGLADPRGIALDVGSGKVYWTNLGTYNANIRTGEKIQRANLDGSNVETLVTTGAGVSQSIALDVGSGKMYWTDLGTYNLSARRYEDGKIQRANLDGSNVETLITTGLSEPSGIALDVGSGKMYWTNEITNKIQRANLNGSNVEDLVTGLRSPFGIALDVDNDKMYWTEIGTNKIHRANLNGSQVEDLVTGLPSPHGIALDVGSGKMYWTDWTTNKIQRANLDGSNVETLVTTGLSDLLGIALDLRGQ